jgi:[ribosomal protein S18]-alanine N-acetyltransferase
VITVRRMREEDIDQVVLLDQMSFSLPWPPSAYRNELQNPGGRTWVAETSLSEPLAFMPPIGSPFKELIRNPGETAIAGMLVLWLILDEAHIASVAVHPQMRHIGIGRELVRTALVNAAGEGAVSALLEVRAGNLTAQNLYREFGFEVVGKRAHYYKDNSEDALLMTLEPLEINKLTAS